MFRVPTPIVITRYLFAIVMVVLFTAGLYLTQGVLSDPIIALLYLLPVVISTANGGLGPGVLSAFFAFGAFNFFFIRPYYSFHVHHTQDLLVLLVFFIVAITTSELVGRAQFGMKAATDREREAIWLYELSTALAGSNDDQAILRILARQCQRTFSAAQVQISLEKAGDREALVFMLPENSASPALRPLCIVPVETTRGLLGEICLWRDTHTISASEERLLRTFASQGALALERSHLAQTATRARVLEESDKLKSALLSSVSHELRTPLATIKAAVTSLRSGEIDLDAASRQDLLAVIEEETDHLNQLVGNLLNMSRLEAGALQVQRNWNVLAEIVQSALHRMRADIKNHQLMVRVSEDLPLVPVDFALLEQVFINLISNSSKYSPEGSLIRIQAQLQGEQTLQVLIANQGPPVPEQHLERIFDKFYRITAADRVTGTGLGLSICKGIIEAHGGRIWAENLDGGFAFKFTLPLAPEGFIPHAPVEAADI